MKSVISEHDSEIGSVYSDFFNINNTDNLIPFYFYVSGHMVHLLSKPIIEERDELSKRKRGNKNGRKEIEKEPL